MQKFKPQRTENTKRKRQLLLQKKKKGSLFKFRKNSVII